MTLLKKLRELFGGEEAPATPGASSPVEPSYLDPLCTTLGYQFNDLSLLKLSLTHKSCASLDDRKGLTSNERLEFLGDSVLNCLVTEHLFFRFPEQDEGELSKVKSLIVSRKILGELGFSLSLDRYIAVSSAERKSRLSINPTIVSNATEALLAAVYLDADGDMAPVRRILCDHLFAKIDGFVNDIGNVNYKSRILELAQADGFGIPTYPLISESGPDHARHFEVSVSVAGLILGHGKGNSKKIAQQEAAFNAVTGYDPATMRELIALREAEQASITAEEVQAPDSAPVV